MGVAFLLPLWDSGIKLGFPGIYYKHIYPEPSCQPCLTLQKTSTNQNSCNSDSSCFAWAALLRARRGSCWLHGFPPWALWCAACPQGHCPSMPFYSPQNQEIHKIPCHGLIFKHNQDFPVFCGHMRQLMHANTS